MQDHLPVAHQQGVGAQGGRRWPLTYLIALEKSSVAGAKDDVEGFVEKCHAPGHDVREVGVLLDGPSHLGRCVLFRRV